MPATDKTTLITLTEKEYAKLTRLLAGIDAADAALSDDGVTIKDIVGHRAHWIDLFLGWYRDGQAGRKVHFPAKGYKWSELKRYNANLRALQADLSWVEAKALLADRHTALTDLITGLSEAELYGSPMIGARNHWTTGRWAEAAGPSHYRSAARAIRSILRAAPTPPPRAA